MATVNPAFDAGVDEIETKNVDDKPDSVITQESKDKDALLYSIEDTPACYKCIILGFQHYFVAVGAIIGIPLILSKSLCQLDTAEGYLGTAMTMSTLFFTSGICTVLQTTFGSRLPVMQGSTFTFLPPTFAILNLPHNKCPSPLNMTLTNGSVLYKDNDGEIVGGRELWERRMREVQGAIIIASLVEFVLGITGAVGFILRFIGPLTIAPSIALIGLDLFQVAYLNAGGQWGIAFFTAGVLIICSQYLKNIRVPVPTFSRRKKCHIGLIYIFKLFPVLIALILAWLLCLALTETNVFPKSSSARTDLRSEVLKMSPWFRFPYPGQWGLPVITGAGVVGMLAGVLAGMVESVGDYYACARLSGAPPPPTHAVNRGITIEGFGCVLAGCLGTGTGTTTFSENIGAIGITRVGSRMVLQVAGCLFILLGMLSKFGAIFVTVPDPVIGGLFCVMFGMITAVGLSNLQYVDMNSPRNLFIIGFSLFVGLTVPEWLKANPGIIQTGVPELNQIFTVLLSTAMFIGGLLGLFLDSTIPGTPKERGIVAWRENTELLQAASGDGEDRLKKCYNLPFSTNFRFAKYIPILPEFEFGEKHSKSPKDDNVL